LFVYKGVVNLTAKKKKECRAKELSKNQNQSQIKTKSNSRAMFHVNHKLVYLAKRSTNGCSKAEQT